jgi:hypothetical protein
VKISDFSRAIPRAVVAGFFCLVPLDEPVRKKEDFHAVELVEVTDEPGKVLIERDTLTLLRQAPNVTKPLRVYYMECVIRRPAVIHSQILFEGDDHVEWLNETIASIRNDPTTVDVDAVAVPPQWDSDPRRKLVLLDPRQQILRVYEHSTIDLPRENQAMGAAIREALKR